MASTTVQLSTELVEELKNRKLYSKESYEDVIWDLIEDSMEISEQTRKEIRKAEKEVARGEVVSLSEIKKKLNL